MKNSNRVKKHVSLPSAFEEYVTRRAKALGISRSAFVERLIRRDLVSIAVPEAPWG
jgi:hypothetical protein